MSVMIAFHSPFFIFSCSSSLRFTQSWSINLCEINALHCAVHFETPKRRKKMNRFDNARPADSRELILDAAVRLLLAKSSNAVSMAMIAAEARVSRRTIFNQFGNKEALFSAAMQRVWTRIPMMEITNSTNALRDPIRTLEQVGLAVMTFWLPQEPIDTARMVIRESARYPTLSETYINRGKRPTLEALVAYMKHLQAADLVAIDDPDLAARQFVGLINEPLVFYRVLGLAEIPHPEQARHVVDEAVKMFFARYPLKSLTHHHKSPTRT
ncbi:MULTISPECIES: TetR/AcrR family transcriptional regulator [unclassified Agrobacterium]|uniref:TetR/AcrR family transcriptional regulator n=1 Tax=unclassified Agrobacterium TaxID=2632611 RepID=UPI001FCC702B|nr:MULTISPECIES: TetR/AcrR family transcriptional regulator [unclassified Agrobacterium]